MKRIVLGIVGALVIAIVVFGSIVAALNFRDEPAIPAQQPAFSPTPAQIQRGEYLARAGNCIACHTSRGGAPYAGGRAITTPFGTLYSTNITPDARTGVGTWTPLHFWRALHNG